jgi:serine/threonine protein kinase
MGHWMTLGPEFRFCREGNWRLWVYSQRWNERLWEEVLSQLTTGTWTKHPQTRTLRDGSGGKETEFYLKIYHRYEALSALKDLFRDSKAVRALKQTEALRREGFAAPLPVAAGEERNFGFLGRAFLLTVAVEGSPLPLFLQNSSSAPLEASGLKRKRRWLRQLALEVRRLHQCGFVHGDLIPSNILVQSNGGATFFYVDNDRTRRYPTWLPQHLWKRNLVQLNRFVLTGISLQDRMRFLRSYLGKGEWGERERRLARWLEKRTRRRRRECDRVEAPQASFRELMRWNGPYV